MSPPITDKEFEAFRRFLHQTTGIQLHQGKKALVCGRLSRRLMQHQLGSYGAYFQFIHSPQGQLEKQHCIDLLTTNETYFFREPRHFQWLEQHLLNRSARGAISNEPFRVWSAACSSGEETYSLAMTLRSHLQGPWEILGSDISTRMLERARSGHYELQRAQGISPEYLHYPVVRGAPLMPLTTPSLPSSSAEPKAAGTTWKQCLTTFLMDARTITSAAGGLVIVAAPWHFAWFLAGLVVAGSGWLIQHRHASALQSVSQPASAIAGTTG